MGEFDQNDGLDRLPLELLVAYADGELSGDDADRAAALVRTDPQAAELVARMRESGRLVAAAFAGPEREPVPEALLQAVRSGGKDESSPSGAVLPFARRPRNRPVVAGWGMALAASVALVIGIGGGFGTARLWTSPDEGIGLARHAAASGPAFQRALDTSVSGVPVALDMAVEGVSVEVMPVLTFRDGEGDICREFQTSLTDTNGTEIGYGIACRSGDGSWQNEVLVAGPMAPHADPSADTMVPASGGNQARFRAIVDSFIGEDTLLPDEERALIDRRWN